MTTDQEGFVPSQKAPISRGFLGRNEHMGGVRVTFTLDTLTMHARKPHRLQGIAWDAVHLTVFDGAMTPIDGFDLYRYKGIWYAWTSDTFSQSRQSRRHLIATEYNRLSNIGKVESQ